MLIFPAIDIFEGKAVRLLKGDYEKMTVYSDNPTEIAKDFLSAGASCIHLVDLEGARSGDTPNLATVEKIVSVGGLFSEIGGGVRSLETVEKYLKIGVNRVILGTSAIEDEKFLREAIAKYGDAISVGVDLKDGFVMTRGWLKNSQITAHDFFEKLVTIGVSHVICTDISRDGAMRGTNRELYGELKKLYNINITASGGVSTMEDIRALKNMELYGAIIGKAYYEGALNLTEAVRVGEC